MFFLIGRRANFLSEVLVCLFLLIAASLVHPRHHPDRTSRSHSVQGSFCSYVPKPSNAPRTWFLCGMGEENGIGVNLGHIWTSPGARQPVPGRLVTANH